MENLLGSPNIDPKLATPIKDLSEEDVLTQQELQTKKALLTDQALALGATPEQLEGSLRTPVDVQVPKQGAIPYGDEFLSDRELSEKLTAPYYEGILEPSNYVTRPATPEDRVPQVTQEPPPESGQFPLGEGPPVSPAAEFSITDMLNKAGDRATSRKAESLRRQKESIQDTLDKPDLPESTRTVLEERVEVLDTITPKKEPPVGNENKTDDVIKAGAKQVAMYDTDDILDMATSEEKTPDGKTPDGKTPEKEGFFKTVVTFLRDTLGDVFEGIIEPDELKKMALFYIGSRSFGNSHEGTLNWLGTRFIADMDRHQAMVDKLTASGKYDPESIELYKQSKNLNDLQPINIRAEYKGGATRMFNRKTNKNVYVLTKDLPGGGVAYVDANTNEDIPNHYLMSSADYDAAYQRDYGSIKENVEGTVKKRILLDRTQDEEFYREYMPSNENIAKAATDYGLRYGIPSQQMIGVIDGVVEDMLQDVEVSKTKISGPIAVETYIGNQVVKGVAGNKNNYNRKDEKGRIPTSVTNNVRSRIANSMPEEDRSTDTVNKAFIEFEKQFNQLVARANGAGGVGPEARDIAQATLDKLESRTAKNSSVFYTYIDHALAQHKG
jgi:hypothetical protein